MSRGTTLVLYGTAARIHCIAYVILFGRALVQDFNVFDVLDYFWCSVQILKNVHVTETTKQRIFNLTEMQWKASI